MNGCPSIGFKLISHAYPSGFLKSIDFFLTEDRAFIELETRDELHMTPFLCSIDGNKIDAAEHLMKAGAKVDVINSHNHGAVEICALKQLSGQHYEWLPIHWLQTHQPCLSVNNQERKSLEF
jgi:hypothetical protein